LIATDFENASNALASQSRLLALTREGAPSVQDLTKQIDPSATCGYAPSQGGFAPIAVLTSSMPTDGAQPGLYLSDWNSRRIWFVSAKQLQAYRGSVLVGTEQTQNLYVLQWSNGGLQCTPLYSPASAPPYDPTGLPTTANLEGAYYL
jgi:hypothetical protein